jgi:hypothetical protein
MAMMFLKFRDLDDQQYQVLLHSLKWGMYKKKTSKVENFTRFDLEGMFQFPADWVNPIEIHKLVQQNHITEDRIRFMIGDLNMEMLWNSDSDIEFLYYDSDEMEYPDKLRDPMDEEDFCRPDWYR